MSWRDLYAGELRTEHVGRRVKLAGWVARRRDHGGLVFVDLRDEGGVVQLVVNPENAPEAARTAHEIRDGFVDVETPIMGKPTPEGARDFLIPTRLQPGRFFALPQSPQIYKQLLVISGFERYYQIARCFRDEDLRADRLQELTQLDVETAFPDQEYLFELCERMMQRVWHDCLGIDVETPFPRLSWKETDLRFGTDKPDLRFGLEIDDATDVTRG